MFCFMGAMASRSTSGDLWVIVSFGILGYLFERFRFPIAPLVLGAILGPLAETSFMTTMISFSNDWTVFFTRPISGAIMALVGLALIYPVRQRVDGVSQAEPPQRGNDSHVKPSIWPSCATGAGRLVCSLTDASHLGVRRVARDALRRSHEMKAIQIERFGGPSELWLADVPKPQPGPGEVLVKLAYAGVNYIDVYMRNGSYARSHTYKTPLPMTIGMEGAGTVAQLGAGVAGFRVGEPVAYCLSRGSYAEFAVVPSWKLVPVPADLDLRIATALMLQGSTAHYLSHSAFPLRPGNTCLVHAGAGGVGQLLIQLAKRAGATVITTVGSEEKAELARRRGADHTVLYRTVDFAEEVKRLTDGKGVDVVYDSVGKDTLMRSLRCLKRRGLCVSFGASSGQPEPVASARSRRGRIGIPHAAASCRLHGERRDEIGGRAGELFAAHRAGHLQVAIDTEFPLGQAAAAHAAIEGRATRGKLLLNIA